MELPKNKTALAVGVAAAGIVTTAALAMAVWPALTRPDPPLEKAGDDGLRIRLVQPPKAVATASSPLEVGLSDAAQAMAKGRENLLVRVPPGPVSPPPHPRPEPVEVAREDVADLAAPPEPAQDPWTREAWRRDRFEQAQLERAQFERAEFERVQRRRWEEARLAREARDEREAREREAREREAWDRERLDRQDRDAAPEQDRYDDRYRPPPGDDRGPGG